MMRWRGIGIGPAWRDRIARRLARLNHRPSIGPAPSIVGLRRAACDHGRAQARGGREVRSRIVDQHDEILMSSTASHWQRSDRTKDSGFVDCGWVLAAMRCPAAKRRRYPQGRLSAAPPNTYIPCAAARRLRR
jgi:hypothetical protein